MQQNQDLVHVFSDYIKGINPQNLGHLIDSYVKYVHTYHISYSLISVITLRIGGCDMLKKTTELKKVLGSVSRTGRKITERLGIDR